MKLVNIKNKGKDVAGWVKKTPAKSIAGKSTDWILSISAVFFLFSWVTHAPTDFRDNHKYNVESEEWLHFDKIIIAGNRYEKGHFGLTMISFSQYKRDNVSLEHNDMLMCTYNGTSWEKVASVPHNDLRFKADYRIDGEVWELMVALPDRDAICATAHDIIVHTDECDDCVTSAGVVFSNNHIIVGEGDRLLKNIDALRKILPIQNMLKNG